jgi:hypothetical protein
MKTKLALNIFLLISSITVASNAAVNVTVVDAPLSSNSDAVISVNTTYPDYVRIGPVPGFEANSVIVGNTINLDVNGFDLLTDFYSGTLTSQANLGLLTAGTYRLNLRYRDSGVPGVRPPTIYPAIRASTTFIVSSRSGPNLITQVPTLSSSASIMLSLLALGFGMFAVRRQ